MFSNLIWKISALPYRLALKGCWAYYLGTLGIQVLCLAVAIIWLLAPIAIWNTFGAWWVLLWLIPTAIGIFMYLSEPPPGGG